VNYSPTGRRPTLVSNGDIVVRFLRCLWRTLSDVFTDSWRSDDEGYDDLVTPCNFTASLYIGML